jgi:hypothetical protein
MIRSLILTAFIAACIVFGCFVTQRIHSPLLHSGAETPIIAPLEVGASAAPATATQPATSAAEEPAAFDGLLRGVVVSELGKAMTDAAVRLSWIEISEWETEVVLLELKARTDNKGRFEFSEGPPGVVRLEVVLDGVSVHRCGFAVPSQDELRIVLAGAKAQPPAAEDGAEAGASAGTCRIEVTVLEPEGGPAAMAEVFLVDKSRASFREGVTEHAGTCVFDGLPPGNYVAAAESALGTSPVSRWALYFPEKRRHLDTTRLPDPGASAQVTIRLDPWARIGGRVVDQDGRPVEGFAVHVSGAERLSSGEVRTDTSGGFQTVVVPGMPYRLAATASPTDALMTSRGWSEEFQPLSPWEVRLDHVLHAEASVRLRLHVRDAAGASVAGASVVSCRPPGISFSSADDGVETGDISPSWTDPDGWLEAWVRPGFWYLLRVSSLHHDPAAVWLDLRHDNTIASLEREVELPSRPLGVIRGVVRAAGRPGGIAARITANMDSKGPAGGISAERYESYRPLPVRVVYAAADGSFRIDGTEPGESYALRFEAEGYSDLQLKAVASGREDVEAELSMPLEIEGRVVLSTGEPVAGVVVEAAGQKARTDASGVFRLRRVAADADEITVDGESVYPATIDSSEVIAAGEVVVEARPRMSGIVLDPDGKPLALARLAVQLRAGNGRFFVASFDLVTDAAGRFERPWPGRQPPQGRGALWVDTGDLPDETWSTLLAEDFDPLAPESVLRFERGVHIVLVLVDPEGAPLPSVGLAYEGSSREFYKSDANGRVDLRRLRRGELSVRLLGGFTTAGGETHILLDADRAEQVVTVKPPPDRR